MEKHHMHHEHLEWHHSHYRVSDTTLAIAAAVLGVVGILMQFGTEYAAIGFMMYGAALALGFLAALQINRHAD